MLVYNTNTTSGAGVYYWATNQWVKVSDGAFTEGDGVIGNEITDTIANGGLTRSGAGTAESPYKVGIKPGGVRTGMIADKAVTAEKINTVAADSGLFLKSLGTNVSFEPLFYRGLATNTLTIRQARSATLNVILNTIVDLPHRAMTYEILTATGLGAYDLCATSAYGFVAPQQNSVRIYFQGGSASSTRILCYRIKY